ncbi:MAG: hypothetical protein LC798_08210 [Chloroflexi bacterium]|nr:hypothetical protein [Chloroflexota bacterium]
MAAVIGTWTLLTETFVIYPAILAVLPEMPMQITSPWILFVLAVTVVNINSYSPFAANGVDGSVLNATKEYCSLAMIPKGSKLT